MNGEYFVAASDLQSVADAIRQKGNFSSSLTYPSGYVAAISSILTEPILQSKTVFPMESDQTIYPDAGYDGLSMVTLEAIPSTYIGSGITKMSSSTYIPGSMNVMISSGTYLLGDLTIAGDSNLLAGNIASGKSIFGITGVVEHGPDSYFRMAIEGSANAAMLSMCSSASQIRSYAFTNAYDIQKVSLPNCTYIGAYAFSGCEYLSRVSLPSCTNIGAYVFRSCSALSSVYIPLISNIGQYAFEGYKSLTSISIPNCSYILTISIPEYCRVWGYAFYGCSLETVYFNIDFSPRNCMSSRAFHGCELKSIYLYRFAELSSQHFSTYFGMTPVDWGQGKIYVNPDNINYLKTTAPYSKYASQYVAWNL